MQRVLGSVLCNLDPKVKVTGQIIYFLVIVSPSKLLNIAASHYTGV